MEKESNTRVCDRKRCKKGPSKTRKRYVVVRKWQRYCSGECRLQAFYERKAKDGGA